MTVELEPQEHMLVEAVRMVIPAVVDQRSEIEATGRLPVALVHALADAGVFSMYTPRELGGLCVRPVALIETVMLLAAADGSTGWTSMICGVQGLYLARLAERDARTILDGPGHGIAGSLTPAGRAQAHEDDYRITGRWGFASGSAQAAWMMAPSIIVDADGPLRDEAGAPRWRVFLLPKDQVRMLDTWHTSGMRGTSSHDFAVDGASVPERFSFDSREPGLYDGPLYRLPVLTSFGAGVGSVCLGIARGAIDELIRLAKEKRPLLSSVPLRERVSVQLQVADAEAALLSARLFLTESVMAVFAAAAEGRTPTLEERTRQRLAGWHCARSALRATELMFEAAGTTAIYASSPLDRAMRDVRVAVQHIVAGPAAHEAAGKALLGLDPGPLV